MIKNLMTCALSALMSTAAMAETVGETMGTAKWSYNTETCELKIEGTGSVGSYRYDNQSKGSTAPWATYASKIKSLKVTEGITEIGQYAFCGCTLLSSVELPKSLVSVSNSAFSNCNSLKSMVIKASWGQVNPGVFNGCSALATVEIEDGIGTIGQAAFADCAALTSIKMPETVTHIDHLAFADCTKLTTIECKSKTAPAIESNSFEGCTIKTVYIPAGSKASYVAAWGDKFTFVEGKAPTSVSNVKAGTSQSEKRLKNGRMVIVKDGKTIDLNGQELR